MPRTTSTGVGGEEGNSAEAARGDYVHGVQHEDGCVVDQLQTIYRAGTLVSVGSAAANRTAVGGPLTAETFWQHFASLPCTNLDQL